MAHDSHAYRKVREKLNILINVQLGVDAETSTLPRGTKMALVAVRFTSSSIMACRNKLLPKVKLPTTLGVLEFLNGEARFLIKLMLRLVHDFGLFGADGDVNYGVMCGYASLYLTVQLQTNVYLNPLQ